MKSLFELLTLDKVVAGLDEVKFLVEPGTPDSPDMRHIAIRGFYHQDLVDEIERMNINPRECVVSFPAWDTNEATGIVTVDIMVHPPGCDENNCYLWYED